MTDKHSQSAARVAQKLKGTAGTVPGIRLPHKKSTFQIKLRSFFPTMSASSSSSAIPERFRLALSAMSDHSQTLKQAKEILCDDDCEICLNADKGLTKCSSGKCGKCVCNDCLFETEIDGEYYCMDCGHKLAESEIDDKREQISDLEAEIETLEEAQAAAEERKEKLEVLREENTKWQSKLMPAVQKYLSYAGVLEAIKKEMEALKDEVFSASGIDLSDHI